MIALIALLLAVGASSAHAATLTLPDGSAAQPEQSWVDSSLVPSAPGAVPLAAE